MLGVRFGAFPEDVQGFPHQLFAVATATVGVAAFAIVLALVEQVSPALHVRCHFPASKPPSV